MVPAEGVERWLTQRLSHRLGAGDARRRRGVRRRAVPLARGRWSPRSDSARERDDDPWDPDALVWPLLEVVDASARRAVVRARSAPHLGHGQTGEEGELRRGRRYAVARRLAGLFASYAVQRPQRWSPTGRGPRHRRGRRAARRRPALAGRAVAAAGRRASPRAPPDVRHAATLARLRAGPRRRSTCRRGCRCSATPGCRSPRSSCSARSASTATCTCGCRTPSAALWDALAGARAAPVPRARRTPPPTCGRPPAARLARPRRPRAAAHAWRAGGRRSSDRRRSRPARAAGPDACSAGCSTTCAANATVDPRRPRRLAADDRSVQVHACHGAGPPGRGAARGAGRAARRRPDPRAARHPGDVPRHRDLRAADLGRLRARRRGRRRGGHPAHRLRVRLADRALTQTNPLLGVAARAARPGRRPGRRPAEVLDLAARRAGPPPVRLHRRRPRAGSPAGSREAGVRWALRRRAPRARSGSTASSQNTWRRPRPGPARASRCPTTTDRLARPRRCRSTTSAATTSTWPAGSPSCVDRLRARDRPAWPAPARRPTGSTRSATGVDALTAVAPRRRVAGRPGRSASSAAVADGAPAAGRRLELRLADVRALLGRAARAAGRPGPTSAPARSPSARWCRCARCRTAWSACSASTTASSRAPARSTATTCSPAARCTGERDPRSEDRQLLLDAVLAATEHAGRHLHRRQRAHRPAAGRPPCRSASCSTPSTRTAADGRSRDRRRSSAHPLQPFDAAQPRPGRLAGARRSPSTAPRSPAPGPPPGRGAARRRSWRRPAAAAGTGATSTLADLLDVPRAPGARRSCAAGSTSPLPRRGRRGRRRAPGRARRPGAVGRRRPAAARPARRRATRDAVLASRVAARRAAAGPARLAARSATSSTEAEPARARPPSRSRTGSRRAPSTSTSTSATAPADRHRPRRLRQPAGARSATPGSAPSSGSQAWVAAARAERRPPRPRAGPRHAIGRGEPVGRSPDGARRPLARVDDRAATCCATWSRCTTRPARAAAAAAQDRATPGPTRAPDRAATTSRPTPRRRASGRLRQRRRFPGEDADPAHVAGLGTRAPLDVLLDARPRPGEERAGETPGSAPCALRLWAPMLAAELVSRSP